MNDNYKAEALNMHEKWRGKLSIECKASINDREDLAIAYTPGVAFPCLEINNNESLAYKYTGKGNLVAVITDGSAVLGLGDIGPAAAMPVMEGKCALFRTFADIDAIPICIDSKDTEEFVDTVLRISKSFGGINLEDISAPRCFEIEKRLIDMCDIPVFHDDQHGTAIITSAAIINALKVTGKNAGNLKIVLSGAGAAGIAIAKMLLEFEFGDIILCGSKGTVYEGAQYNNKEQELMAKLTNKERLRGRLEDAISGADIFIGVSKGGIVSEDMIRSMNKDAIVFALANPVPEIMPDAAKRAGAAIVGTGRSDFPNQINNVLAFPGIFRGALDCRAKKITDKMKINAAKAIASAVSEAELSADNILPDIFNPLVVKRVSEAIMRTYNES